MADQKISELTSFSTLANADVFVAVDDDAVSTKKISWANILANITITESQISDFGTYSTASATETLTNKTFDANGTGNSISNIDVADLANGTDGELITWDASGVPTTVGVGTSGQVLTSNGAGSAPTFQDNSGQTNKELFILFLSDQDAFGYTSSIGGYPLLVISSTQSARTAFKVPSDFGTLTDIKVIMIPDATETIQFDCTTTYGAIGEAYNVNDITESNISTSATQNQMLAVSLTGSTTFDSLDTNDYCGIRINSDTSDLRLVGISITYTTT